MASSQSATDQLTKRQCDVFYFIREKIQTRGYGPTVREIGEAFEISSLSFACAINSFRRTIKDDVRQPVSLILAAVGQQFEHSPR